MLHLDIHNITTPTRSITQTIAVDAHDRLNAAAIRYPSRIDGLPCYALFEHRGHLKPLQNPIPLTDPKPLPLQHVLKEWNLKTQPT